MPRVGQKRLDPEFEYALDRLKDFDNESNWKRSKKGNLWREWDGMTVSIFKGKHECFKWSVKDEDGMRYSRAVFDTEEEAIYALGDDIGVPGI